MKYDAPGLWISRDVDMSVVVGLILCMVFVLNGGNIYVGNIWYFDIVVVVGVANFYDSIVRV